MDRKLPEELYQIHNIAPKLYLSGIIPVASIKFPSIAKDHGIRLVISCSDHPNTNIYHQNLIRQNELECNQPIYCIWIKYRDRCTQNLWSHNNDQDIVCSNNLDGEQDIELLSLIQRSAGKPCIDVSYAFSDWAISRGYGVIIHCMAGVSRSVSMICYYLMKQTGCSMNDALQHVKSIRIIANPNGSFTEQLKSYEKLREFHTVNNSDDITITYQENGKKL